MPRVLTREKIPVEERLKVDKIDAVILDVAQTLGFVPCVHALQCICIMHMCQCEVTGAWWTERWPAAEDWRLGTDVHGGKCRMGDLTMSLLIWLPQLAPAGCSRHFLSESLANARVSPAETSNKPVVPAKAGTQSTQDFGNTMDWIPAFAGMTRPLEVPRIQYSPP